MLRATADSSVHFLGSVFHIRNERPISHGWPRARGADASPTKDHIARSMESTFSVLVWYLSFGELCGHSLPCSPIVLFVWKQDSESLLRNHKFYYLCNMNLV